MWWRHRLVSDEPSSSRKLTQPFQGWRRLPPKTQGSSFLATLGFEAESLWRVFRNWLDEESICRGFRRFSCNCQKCVSDRYVFRETKKRLAFSGLPPAFRPILSKSLWQLNCTNRDFPSIAIGFTGTYTEFRNTLLWDSQVCRRTLLRNPFGILPF